MEFNDLNQVVADRLLRGEVGVIPTDTVYGVAACALNQSAGAHVATNL